MATNEAYEHTQNMRFVQIFQRSIEFRVQIYIFYSPFRYIWSDTPMIARFYEFFAIRSPLLKFKTYLFFTILLARPKAGPFEQEPASLGSWYYHFVSYRRKTKVNGFSGTGGRMLGRVMPLAMDIRSNFSRG